MTWLFKYPFRRDVYTLNLMEEIDAKKTEKFVKEVMMTERRYGTDQKNQKSNRQSDIRDCLEKFVVKELSDEDK